MEVADLKPGMPEANRQRLEARTLELQSNIQKLIVEDFTAELSPDALPLRMKPTQQVEVCVQIAVLSHLYGSESYHKLLLEAYLWTPTTCQMLSEIGWLEGGVVVIDKHREIVQLPSADLPARTLRLPRIRLYDHVSEGLREMMPSWQFKRAWVKISEQTDLLPGLDPSCRDIVLKALGREIFDHNDRTSGDPVHEHLVKHIRITACEIEKSLFPDAVPQSYESASIRDALMVHLTSILENMHIRNLRLTADSAQEDHQQHAEFLKFFDVSPQGVSNLERQLKVLLVPDGEVSFLLLEHALSLNDTVSLSEEDARTLGLLHGERAGRMADWLRDILGMTELNGFNEHDWENYRPLLTGKTWIWLDRMLQKHRLELLQVVEQVYRYKNEGKPLIVALRELCIKFWPDHTTRKVQQLQNVSPI